MIYKVSVESLRRAIKNLPSDEPKNDPAVWYRTQKEHWLRWLREYHGPGAYGRLTSKRRDGRFAYNHAVNPKMLLWLIEAAGVPRKSVTAARRASAHGTTMMQKSGAIRRQVPWEMLRETLWNSNRAS
jgi:hypothetical protein